MIANRAADLTSAPGGDRLGTLEAGDVVDVFEIGGALSWGQRRGDGLVGYIASDALDRAGRGA